jgi:hypothetical protein
MRYLFSTIFFSSSPFLQRKTAVRLVTGLPSSVMKKFSGCHSEHSEESENAVVAGLFGKILQPAASE